MRNSPEFSRPIRVDRLSAAPLKLPIEASESERAALAERFDLITIDRLDAEAALTRSGDQVTAKGMLHAKVTQSCVATGEPVQEDVAEEFTIFFRPQPAGAAADEEIELSEGEMDVVFYEGGAVDIGEAVAETLSLGLNPYPRAPEADSALKEAGVKSETEAKAEEEAAKLARSPFAALRKD